MAITDILTPAYFRTMYLQGIRASVAACGLGGAANAWALPDEVIVQHVMSAVAYVGSELDIDIRSHGARIIADKYDQMDWHGGKWYMKSARTRPVLRVYELAVQRGVYASASSDGFEAVPDEWVQIASPEQGTIVVTPYSGAPASLAHLPWGSHLDTWYRYMPLFVRIKHSTGFEYNLIGTTTVVAGSNTATVSGTGADDPQQILQVGMKVKLGAQVVSVTDTPTSTTFSFTPVHHVGFAGTAVVMAYDPMILNAVAYHALIPVLESIASAMYGPVSSQSVGIDSMSQSKTFAVTPRTSALYSQQLRAQERLDKEIASLATRYRAFNMFTF
jgi:hypothetical protein